MQVRKKPLAIGTLAAALSWLGPTLPASAGDTPLDGKLAPKPSPQAMATMISLFLLGVKALSHITAVLRTLARFPVLLRRG